MKAHIKALLILLLFALLLPTPIAEANAVVFATPYIATGVATDAAGNLFVAGATNPADPRSQLMAFRPDGTYLGATPISPYTYAHIALDSQTGVVYALASDSQLSYYNPATGQTVLLFRVCELNTDVSGALNVATGRTDGLFFLAGCTNTRFGDLSLLRRGNVFDFFLTGISQYRPFVQRIRFVNNQFHSSRVILASSSGSFTVREPRGIAMSPQGIGISSLTNYQEADLVLAFSADLPESENQQYGVVVAGLVINGATSDSQGNFYLSTASFISSAVCRTSYRSVLIFLPANLDRQQGRCLDTGTPFSAGDVTLSPDARMAYFTSSNAVFRLAIAAPQQSRSAIVLHLASDQLLSNTQSAASVQLLFAAQAGEEVLLTSSDPLVQVPERIVLAAGQQLAQFTIQSGSVLQPTTVTITASFASEVYALDVLVIPHQVQLPLVKY
ncbi:MAG: hypothetical protein Fur005_45960 [Roseiflexaceae bacterium]